MSRYFTAEKVSKLAKDNNLAEKKVALAKVLEFKKSAHLHEQVKDQYRQKIKEILDQSEKRKGDENIRQLVEGLTAKEFDLGKHAATMEALEKDERFASIRSLIQGVHDKIAWVLEGAPSLGRNLFDEFNGLVDIGLDQDSLRRASLFDAEQQHTLLELKESIKSDIGQAFVTFGVSKDDEKKQRTKYHLDKDEPTSVSQLVDAYRNLGFLIAHQHEHLMTHRAQEINIKTVELSLCNFLIASVKRQLGLFEGTEGFNKLEEIGEPGNGILDLGESEKKGENEGKKEIETIVPDPKSLGSGQFAQINQQIWQAYRDIAKAKAYQTEVQRTMPQSQSGAMSAPVYAPDVSSQVIAKAQERINVLNDEKRALLKKKSALAGLFETQVVLPEMPETEMFRSLSEKTAKGHAESHETEDKKEDTDSGVEKNVQAAPHGKNTSGVPEDSKAEKNGKGSPQVRVRESYERMKGYLKGMDKDETVGSTTWGVSKTKLALQQALGELERDQVQIQSEIEFLKDNSKVDHFKHEIHEKEAKLKAVREAVQGPVTEITKKFQGIEQAATSWLMAQLSGSPLQQGQAREQLQTEIGAVRAFALEKVGGDHQKLRSIFSEVWQNKRRLQEFFAAKCQDESLKFSVAERDYFANTIFDDPETEKLRLMKVLEWEVEKDLTLTDDRKKRRIATLRRLANSKFGLVSELTWTARGNVLAGRLVDQAVFGSDVNLGASPWLGAKQVRQYRRSKEVLLLEDRLHTYEAQRKELEEEMTELQNKTKEFETQKKALQTSHEQQSAHHQAQAKLAASAKESYGKRSKALAPVVSLQGYKERRALRREEKSRLAGEAQVFKFEKRQVRPVQKKLMQLQSQITRLSGLENKARLKLAEQQLHLGEETHKLKIAQGRLPISSRVFNWLRGSKVAKLSSALLLAPGLVQRDTKPGEVIADIRYYAGLLQNKLRLFPTPLLYQKTPPSDMFTGHKKADASSSEAPSAPAPLTTPTEHDKKEHHAEAPAEKKEGHH